MAREISVLLADDHALVRSGLRALVETMAGLHVAGEVASGQELLAWVERTPDQPDILVTDLSMPGPDVLQAIPQVLRLHPAVRVLVLTMHDSADHVRGAVTHGAHGYLMKNACPDELEHALRMLAGGGSYFSDSAARCLLKPAVQAEDELTQRQIDVLRLIARGHCAKEIAHVLGLSAKTVDVHRARIMDRLGIHSVAGLTRYAIRKRLAQP